mgnify:CR=1 FL=1|tara:strand:+ start:19223 stop:19372 length:150 start_codon:yes stop_codon:yes gene_type:complete
MAKKLSAKQKKLAAFAPPRNKITRADIITAAKNKSRGQKNARKKSKKSS